MSSNLFKKSQSGYNTWEKRPSIFQKGDAFVYRSVLEVEKERKTNRLLFLLLVLFLVELIIAALISDLPLDRDLVDAFSGIIVVAFLVTLVFSLIVCVFSIIPFSNSKQINKKVIYPHELEEFEEGDLLLSFAEFSVNFPQLAKEHEKFFAEISADLIAAMSEGVLIGSLGSTSPENASQAKILEEKRQVKLKEIEDRWSNFAREKIAFMSFQQDNNIPLKAS